MGCGLNGLGPEKKRLSSDYGIAQAAGSRVEWSPSPRFYFPFSATINYSVTLTIC